MLKKWFVFFYAAFLATSVFILVHIAINLDKEHKNTKEQVNLKEELNNISKYINDNNIKEKIKLKITDTNQVKEILVSDYLKGVLPAEMPPDYGIEALKAQAIVARTYLYQKMGTNAHNDADICDNPSHCQAYLDRQTILTSWEKNKGYDKETRDKYMRLVEQAVDSTENIVVTYKGSYIRAYFHACSGGKTENVYNIWGKQKIPYLISVDSPGEESYRNYSSKVTLSVSKLQEKLNNSAAVQCNIDENRGDIVQVLSYTDTDRVDKVKIGGVIYTAETLRTKLGLRSTNFSVEYNEGNVIFHVTGNGHGVGMSQVGASYLASIGYTFDQIILHYYTGVDVTYVNKEE